MSRARVSWLAIVAFALTACRTAALPAPPDDLAAPPDLTTTNDLIPATILTNACGGDTMLAHDVGTMCSACGYWICDGTDGVRCSDATLPNACGTCGPPPIEICNGVDDDCDGVVDPGCPHFIAKATDWPVAVRIANGRVAYQSAVLEGKSYAHVFALDGTELLGKSEGANPALSERYFVQDGAVRAYDFTTQSWIAYAGVDQTRTMRLPVVDGERVVFVDASNTIVAWTIGSATLDTIRDGKPPLETVRELALAGDWLVFGSGYYAQSPRALSAYNFATKETHDLEQHGANVDVAEGWAVWHAKEVENASDVFVFAYHLATGEQRNLGLGNAPRIAGHRVCFDAPDERNWNRLLHVYDLDAATDTALPLLGTGCDLDSAALTWTTPLLQYYDLPSTP